MTITVNYSPRPSPGYVPRKSATIHNVLAVVDDGIGRVKVKFIFQDDVVTHDHVVSVACLPERPEAGE